MLSGSARSPSSSPYHAVPPPSPLQPAPLGHIAAAAAHADALQQGMLRQEAAFLQQQQMAAAAVSGMRLSPARGAGAGAGGSSGLGLSPNASLLGMSTLPGAGSSDQLAALGTLQLPTRSLGGQGSLEASMGGGGEDPIAVREGRQPPPAPLRSPRLASPRLASACGCVPCPRQCAQLSSRTTCSCLCTSPRAYAKANPHKGPWPGG